MVGRVAGLQGRRWSGDGRRGGGSGGFDLVEDVSRLMLLLLLLRLLLLRKR